MIRRGCKSGKTRCDCGGMGVSGREREATIQKEEARATWSEEEKPGGRDGAVQNQ